MIRLFFCLLEAAFKIHLAQKSEGARVPLVSMGMKQMVRKFQKYGHALMCAL